jgi:NADH-quinone oxidoreductase subunit I
MVDSPSGRQNPLRSAWAIVKGLTITFKHLLRKPVTVQYPFEKVPMYPRYRGMHFLERYEDGTERCVCCGLCAKACPADCIYMEPSETSDGIMYARVYEINLLRCIYCGLCEEACPEEAIFLGKEYEFSNYTRESFVAVKDDLLVPWPRERPSPIEFLRTERRVLGRPLIEQAQEASP